MKKDKYDLPTSGYINMLNGEGYWHLKGNEKEKHPLVENTYIPQQSVVMLDKGYCYIIDCGQEHYVLSDYIVSGDLYEPYKVTPQEEIEGNIEVLMVSWYPVQLEGFNYKYREYWLERFDLDEDELEGIIFEKDSGLIIDSLEKKSKIGSYVKTNNKEISKSVKGKRTSKTSSELEDIVEITYITEKNKTKNVSVSNKDWELQDKLLEINENEKIKHIKLKGIAPVCIGGLFSEFPITSVDLTDFDVSNTEEINDLFYNCKNITEIDLSSWNLKKVNFASYIFCNCENLKILKLGDWNTNNITIKEDKKGILEGCKNLKELETKNLELKKEWEKMKKQKENNLEISLY